MNFFLNGTREALGFDQVLHLICPQSIYGKGEKSRLRPFLPGEEGVLRQELAKVRECAGKLPGVDQQLWQKILSNFAMVPNILEEAGLAKQGLTLNEVNLFNMKKFLYLSYSLYRLLKEAQLLPEENYSVLLPPEELVEGYLNKNQGYQFYLGDYGEENYHELQSEIKRLSALSAEIAKIETEYLESEMGIKDNGLSGSYLYVDINNQELLKKAAENPRLEKYQDFGREICFVRKTAAAERKIDEELKKTKQRLEDLESDIKRQLTGLIRKYILFFDQGIKEIGYMDWLLAKSVFMIGYGCSVPQVLNDKEISLCQGVNLNIKHELGKNNKEFTPITLNFNKKSMIITGANMGGKTVTLKTLGLAVAMAQHGIPVPADDFSFPLFRFIFCAGEYKEKTGLSSFATEIERLKMILNRAEEKGLVLLDEPARSTNPQEGLAIVGAFLRRMSRGNSTAIVITHFEGLARLAEAEHWQVRGVKNVEKILREEDLEKYFDYSLEKVEVSTQVPRDAIKVAELLGLDKGVLAEAKSLFQEIVKGGSKW